MCGIAGELRFDGRPDLDALRRMQDAVARRGPDGDGLWCERGAGLAHRRLSVIDLSLRGAQPMVDADLGYAIVFNGCIYNHHELRAELEGHGYRFFSTSDTEVILKAYHRWGERCVEHFLGMFAFVLVERESGRAVLARDRLGIKPLYLAEVDGGLRFASTLPALLAAGGIDTSLDPVALHHYLMFHSVVPAPRTVLNGVRKLPPATVAVVEADGRRREHRYWRARFERDAISVADWPEAVREALRLAVRRRMVSDVPVGVLLSGGLDSSLIVALLAESGQRGLATFSVGFEAAGDREGDEFKWSDIVARQYGTDHRKFRVGAERMIGALDGAVAAMSEPMVSHDAVAFYLLSEEVSKHRKVVQSGQGADEVFAGYYWYPPVHAAAEADAVEAYRSHFFDRPAEEIAETLGPSFVAAGDPSLELVRRHFAEPGAETPVDRALRIDQEIMLVDDPVKRVDNMTMAWGLEARTPFLDHELVELAAACPPELKLAHGGKGVLKEAARGLLDDDVIFRPKGYFPVPALSHLEGPVLEMAADALTSTAARERGLVAPEHVELLLSDPNGQRTTLDGSKLWQLTLLELWLQRHRISPSGVPEAAADGAQLGDLVRG